MLYLYPIFNHQHMYLHLHHHLTIVKKNRSEGFYNICMYSLDFMGPQLMMICYEDDLLIILTLVSLQFYNHSILTLSD